MLAQRGILLAGAAAAVIGTGFGAYGVHQARQAAAARESSETELRQQIQALTARLEAKESARPSPLPQARPVRDSVPVGDSQPSARRPNLAKARQTANKGVQQSPDNREIKRMEERISAQDQRLSSAEKTVEETRADLEGRLSSAQTELGASIARTHEEMAALQKLGQRDYFEFHLAKSKQLTAAGPIRVALRKSDTKRKRYNLDLLIDDAKLEKKNINIFEPLYFRLADRPQPIELVVNAIEKNRVHGYVSVPKYKQSELLTQSR